MGWFRRATPMNLEEVERMKSELRSLKDALDKQRSSTLAIARRLEPPVPATQVEDLAARITKLEDRPSPDPEAPDRAAQVEDLAARITKLEDRPSPDVDAPDPAARLEELAAQVAALDARVTAVSTELANQLTELGKDIDALDARAEDGPDETVLGELRDGQVRLANEQARYQIAFREDLARLAEQLRRPRT